MNDTRYLYEIRPVRPVIISGKSVRRPCSAQLTKEEVKEFMKSAAIYRKFANTTLEPIKVTGETLDMLHQPTYNPNYKPFEETIVEETVEEIQEEVEVIEENITETEEPEVINEEESTEEVEPEKQLNEEESSVISSEEETTVENAIVEDSSSVDTVQVVEDKKEEVKVAPTFNVKNNYHGKNHKNNYKK